MLTEAFTNIFADGEVAGRNPDAVDDYYKITDAQQDHYYNRSKMANMLKLLSSDPTVDFYILYGGVVTDNGGGTVNISAGAAITVDNNDRPCIVNWPALNGVTFPVAYKDNRQVWVTMKYDFKYGAATRNHYIGTNYHYQLEDTYSGDTSGYLFGSVDDMFTDADPTGDCVILASIKIDGANVFTDVSEGEKSPTLRVKETQDGEDEIGVAKVYTSEILPSSGRYQWMEGASLLRASYPKLFSRYYVNRGTVTISGPATPAVVALAGHNFKTGSCISLGTTGALWTGFAVDTNYFVIWDFATDGNDAFRLATSADNARAGTAIASSGSQSGTHTLYSNPHGINGANSFYLPDGDGLVMRQTGDLTINGRTKTGVGLGAEEEDQMQGFYILDVNLTAGAAVSGGVNYANQITNRAPITDGTNGTPRTGTTTRDNSMGVKYIVRVI